MPNEKSHIVVVLDRSGSMQGIKEDMIGGFNQFLEQQQRAPGDAVLTLTRFDHEWEIVHRRLPIDQVPQLTESSYQPRGSTALLDALGFTIAEVESQNQQSCENDRTESVIFLTITDGLENASRRYTRSQVLEMISHLRVEQDWEFIFVGTTEGAIEEAGGLGMPTAHAVQYEPSPSGTQTMYRSVIAATLTSRGWSRW